MRNFNEYIHATSATTSKIILYVCGTCQLSFVDEIFRLDDSITVSSSSDIGDSVYTLRIQEAGSVTTTTEPTTTTEVIDMDAKRRRREEPTGHSTGEHDILLVNESSNFALSFCKLRRPVKYVAFLLCGHLMYLIRIHSICNNHFICIYASDTFKG